MQARGEVGRMGGEPLDVAVRRASQRLHLGAGGGVLAAGEDPDRPADRLQRGEGSGAVSSWREAFLAAPYLRDTFVAVGVLSDTFETAITWDRFADFHAHVMAAAHDAVRRVCGVGQVSCRFTHVYPDGPAPYYTVLAPGRKGGQR